MTFQEFEDTFGKAAFCIRAIVGVGNLKKKPRCKIKAFPCICNLLHLFKIVSELFVKIDLFIQLENCKKQTVNQKHLGRGSDAFQKRILPNWTLYLLLAVPLLFVAVFNYAPMYGVIMAFEDYSPIKGIFKSEWIGFENFVRFFSTPSAWEIIRNTLLISLYGLVMGMPFPIILAICLNEVKSVRFKKIVQMVTYAPYFISTVVLVSIVIMLLDPTTGIVNLMLDALGLETVNFLGEPSMFRWIYVWSGIWQMTGFNAIIYIAALSSANQELYEAARIDGANKFQKVWYIDLPYILPTLIIITIMNFGSIMNVGFEKVYLMQNPSNLDVSEVLSTYTYKKGLLSLDYGYSAAVGIFNSVVNTIFIVTVNMLARKFSDTSLW